MPHKDPEARRAYSRAYYAANQERIKALVVAWGKTPKGQAYRRDFKRNWRAANRVREREKGLAYARSKKATPTRPEPMSCEVCGGRTKRRLHLDHDHLTEQFRGWLCGRCNAALGYAQDSPVILRALATYLERAWSS